MNALRPFTSEENKAMSMDELRALGAKMVEYLQAAIASGDSDAVAFDAQAMLVMVMTSLEDGFRHHACVKRMVAKEVA